MNELEAVELVMGHGEKPSVERPAGKSGPVGLGRWLGMSQAERRAEAGWAVDVEHRSDEVSDRVAVLEKIAVMQAYVEGKRIEAVPVNMITAAIMEITSWSATSTPIWDWGNYRYRVAPEPEEDIEPSSYSTSYQVSVMEACMAGSAIERRAIGSAEWECCSSVTWNWEKYRYRIGRNRVFPDPPQPLEPKYRPYTDEELAGLVGTCVGKGDSKLLVTSYFRQFAEDSRGMHGVVTIGSPNKIRSAEELLSHRWKKDDGSLCGVLEE